MRNIHLRFILPGFLFAGGLLGLSAGAPAAVPETLNYQGRLRTSAGDNVPDGPHQIVARLYNGPLVGTPLWMETHTSVSTTAGLFNIQLGSIVPLTGLPFDQPYWLGIAADGDSEMTPRTPLSSAPYAFRAKLAEGAVGPLSATASLPVGVVYAQNTDSVGAGIYGVGKPGFLSSVGVKGIGGHGVWGESNEAGGIGVRGEAGGVGGVGVLARSVAGPALLLSGTASIAAAPGLSLTVNSFVSFTAGTNLGGGLVLPYAGLGSTPALSAAFSVTNTGAGYGILGWAGQPGTLGNEAPGIDSLLSAGVVGRSGVSASAGVAGFNSDTSGESAGVIAIGASLGLYARGLSAAAGINAESEHGTAGRFEGKIGIDVSTTVTAGTALRARSNGWPAARALEVQGDALFSSGAVTFSPGVTVDFSGATVRNLSVSSFTGSAIVANNNSINAAIYAQNDGGGTGVYGVSVSGPGLYGQSATYHGVHGRSNSTAGYGVLAQNLNGGAALRAEASSGIGAIVQGSNKGLSVTATSSSGEAIIAAANTNSSTILAINDSSATNTQAIYGSATGSGTGVKGDVLNPYVNAKAIYGSIPSGPGPQHAFAVYAENPSTSGVNASGAALFVHGAIKVNYTSLNESTPGSGTWNINNGSPVSGGPAWVVKRTSGSFTSCTSIVFKSPMITPYSVVMFSTTLATPYSGGYLINVSSGQAVITFSGTGPTFNVNDGFNLLVIN
jgi:hypothetical protein